MTEFSAATYVTLSIVAGFDPKVVIQPNGQRGIVRDFVDADLDAMPPLPPTDEDWRAVGDLLVSMGRVVDYRPEKMRQAG